MKAFKPTWVFVAGMYRTGSTTHYCMTRDIVEETGRGIGIGYHKENKFAPHDTTTKAGQYVVCKVFIYLPETSPIVKQYAAQERIKAVMTVRDPRDIVVSMRFRHDRRLPNGRKSSDCWNLDEHMTNHFQVWLDNQRKWQNLGPNITMLTRFEDMMPNLYEEAMRIANHLRINLASGMARNIAGRYTARSMGVRKRRYGDAKAHDPSLREDQWLPSIPAVEFGTSGHWEEHLSQQEAALIENHCSKYMEQWGYL